MNSKTNWKRSNTWISPHGNLRRSCNTAQVVRHYAAERALCLSTRATVEAAALCEVIAWTVVCLSSLTIPFMGFGVDFISYVPRFITFWGHVWLACRIFGCILTLYGAIMKHPATLRIALLLQIITTAAIPLTCVYNPDMSRDLVFFCSIYFLVSSVVEIYFIWSLLICLSIPARRGGLARSTLHHLATDHRLSYGSTHVQGHRIAGPVPPLYSPPSYAKSTIVYGNNRSVPIISDHNSNKFQYGPPHNPMMMNSRPGTFSSPTGSPTVSSTNGSPLITTSEAEFACQLKTNSSSPSPPGTLSPGSESPTTPNHLTPPAYRSPMDDPASYGPQWFRKFQSVNDYQNSRMEYSRPLF